jgi:hypothetical protein
VVRAGGRTYRRDVAAGDSYVSSHDARMHVASADQVTVIWPGGRESVVANVPARRPSKVSLPPR